MKLSKRFIKSTHEIIAWIIMLLDFVWFQTGILALFSLCFFFFRYIVYRREAVLNREHSKEIRETMTLSDIQYIETKYTQRPDFNSPEKRARVRSPLDRFFYHYRYEKVQSLLRTHAAHCRKILDLGCGFGRNTRFISEDLGKTGWGLELDHLKLVWARSETKRRKPGLPPHYICGDAARPPFASGSFDGIVFTEVLEHLINPMAGLDACRDLLRPNGILIITVPSHHNLGYSSNPFIVVEKLLSLRKESVLPPFHNLHAQFEYNWKKPEEEYGMHYHFTRQKIKQSLRERGFSTLWSGSFEYEVYPLLLIEMLAGGNMKKIEKYTAGIEAVLSNTPLIRLLGQHLIFIAVKK